MLLLVAGVVFFQSCGSKQDIDKESANNGEKKTGASTFDNQKQSLGIDNVVDKNYGDILAKFDKSLPEKVISIAPSTTELLYEYGVGNLIIAAVEPHNYPVEAKKLDSVGNLSLNIEKIVLLKPDIIIGEKNLFLGQLASLQDLGIPLLLFDTRTPEDLTINLFVFDRLFHQSKAQELERETFRIINLFPKPKKELRIACVISSTPLILAGPDSWVSSLMELAGCKNVMSDAPGDYIPISREEFIAKDPEIIIITFKGIENELRKEKSFDGLKAIKADHLYLVDPDIFLRPTLRSIKEGVRMIREFHG